MIVACFELSNVHWSWLSPKTPQVKGKLYWQPFYGKEIRKYLLLLSVVVCVVEPSNIPWAKYITPPLYPHMFGNPKKILQNNSQIQEISQIQKNIPNIPWAKYITPPLYPHMFGNPKKILQRRNIFILRWLHTMTQYCSATTTPKPKTEPRTAPPSTTKSTTLVRPGPKKGGTKYLCTSMVQCEIHTPQKPVAHKSRHIRPASEISLKVISCFSLTLF